MPPLLTVTNLVVEYGNGRKKKRAVDDVSFSVAPGTCAGLVGGSGSGKTTTARAVAGLEKPASGEIVFDGTDVLRMTPPQRAEYRRNVQLVFQDTLGALNPRMTVGTALREVLHVHRRNEFPDTATANDFVATLLERVELPAAVAASYPHEISGGQRQRVGIARALAVNPRMIIADEPVSALDVAVQAHMLKMLRRLVDDTGLTLMFIAHDLAVVRCICDTAVVMHQGRVVDVGNPADLFGHPATSFTKTLVNAVPDITRALAERQL